MTGSPRFCGDVMITHLDVINYYDFQSVRGRNSMPPNIACDEKKMEAEDDEDANQVIELSEDELEFDCIVSDFLASPDDDPQGQYKVNVRNNGYVLVPERVLEEVCVSYLSHYDKQVGRAWDAVFSAVALIDIRCRRLCIPHKYVQEGLDWFKTNLREKYDICYAKIMDCRSGKGLFSMGAFATKYYTDKQLRYIDPVAPWQVCLSS